MANDLNRSIKIYLDNSAAMTSADELQKRIGQLESKLIDLQTAGKGNTDQAKKVEKELIAQTQKFEKYKREVADTERVLKNLSGATYNELLKAKKDIDKQLRSTTRNTELYNQRLEVQKSISKELAYVQKELRTEIGCQATSWGRAAGFVNKYMGLIGSALASVTGLTIAFNRMREERDKLEESKADVKALTGLDDESIQWLTEQARKLSENVTKDGIRIRQSATEILEAYKLVGSAKPELLANKEALADVTEQTLILASASGMKLTDAVDAVTLALNQYGAGADEAAKYVNILAAGSKFGAAAVESQTKAIKSSGVAAASANVPIEQLVGTIETLAEKGIKDEIAGTGLKKFFLTLQTGADETNPKVVGLEKALENLSKKQMDATAIKKMFGEEGYNVASVLINETDKVKKYTEAVTGTSVALEQAKIKSETASAKLAQAKNKINDLGIDLLEKLNPAITGAVDLTVEWSGKLVSLATWIGKNSGLFISLTTLIGLYTAGIKLNTYWTKLKGEATSKAIVAEKANMIAMKASAAAEHAMAAAKALLTGKIKAATVAMRSFLVTLGLNPIVAIGVAIAALTIGIYKLATRTTEAKEAMNSFLESSIKEQTELDKLYGALKRSGEGTEQRTKLINEFNTKYGEYLPNLLSEKSTLEEIKTAYENATKAMRENLAQKALNAKIEEIETDALENKTKELNDIRNELSVLPETLIGDAVSDIVRQVDKGKEKGFELEAVWVGVFSNLKKNYFNKDSDSIPAHLANQLKDYVKEVYKAADKVKAVKKELSPFLPKEKEEPVELPEVVVTAKAKNKPSTPVSDEEQKKITDAKLKEVDRFVQQEKLKLKDSYLQNLMDKAEYNQKLEMLELEALNRRMAIYGLDKDKQAEIQDKILSYKVKILEQTRKFEESQEKYRQKAEAKRKKAKEKALNDELQMIVAKNQEQQKAEFENEIEHRKKMMDLATGFSAQVGEILGESLTNSETSFAEAMGNILLLTLDALRQMATMAIAEATIKNAPKGPFGWALAAAEIAMINVAFGALKGLIKKPTTSSANSGLNNNSSSNTGSRVVSDGFYVGGFTGHGSPYAVSGPTHFEEYVVPSFVMNEPAAMNHVAALEAMRRQKTNANPLPGTVNGFANGGYSGNPPTSNNGNDNSEMLLSVMKRLIVLLGNLEGGIKAYVVYSDLERKRQTLEKTRRLGGK